MFSPAGLTTKHLSFGYDPRGNRISQSGTTALSYGYDQVNHLINFNNGAATFAYNGDGLRMSKTRAGATEQYVWDIGAGLPLLLQDKAWFRRI